MTQAKAFHAAVNLGGWCAAVVYGEFHEHQIGFLIEHILLKPEDAEVGAGAADGGIDLADFCVGILLLEVSQRFGTPAFLGGDGASEVCDADFFSRLKFSKKIMLSRRF